MKIDRTNLRHWLLLLLQRFYTLLAIVLRPFAKKPLKPLVLLYGHQFSGNLKALYEEWTRSFQGQLSIYYLTLDPKYSETLRKQGVAVLRCDRLGDMLSLTRASAMITDHGLHAMSPLVRFTSIKFIDVWHGIPFKGFIPEDFRVQRRYDQVWVPSKLLKQLYEEKFGFSRRIVKVMGYARTDKLFRGEFPEPYIRAGFSIPSGKKIVLYAPTWRQDDQGRELFPFSLSQENFIDALSQACRGFDAALLLRSHLNAEISQTRFNNVYHVPMAAFPDTEALLMETDILISDWSSIVFDFLTLNRPTLFLDVPAPFKHGLSLGREYRYGQVVSDIHGLVSAVGSVLGETDQYFSDFSESHQRVCRLLYSEQTQGMAANKQLKELTNLVESIQ